MPDGFDRFTKQDKPVRFDMVGTPMGNDGTTKVLLACILAALILGAGYFLGSKGTPTAVYAPPPAVTYTLPTTSVPKLSPPQSETGYVRPNPATRDPRCNPCAAGYIHDPRFGAACGCGRI